MLSLLCFGGLLFVTTSAQADPSVQDAEECERSGCFTVESSLDESTEEQNDPEWVQVGVAPAVELGREDTVAAVISPLLTIRTWQGLRLGASYTFDDTIIDGLEGCSTATICHDKRWRLSGRAEYQFGTRGFVPWLALELGREHWSGTDMTASGFPEISGTRTVWAGQAGFDAVIGQKDAIGLGLFVSYVGQQDSHGLGAGARLIVGFF